MDGQEKLGRLLSIAAAAVAAGAATPAAAGEPAAEAIVVTGKQPDRLIEEMPASVRLFDNGELSARHVDDLTSLSFAAPNVSLDAIGTFRGVANFSIRGLGINSSIPSIDPAVGLIVDGVYNGINAGSLFDMLDVERVQVLRGPQSVLFGHNTTGGAILVTTGAPTATWEGRARLNFETPVDKGRGSPLASARISLAGPLSDRFAMRLAALRSSDGGYFRNDFDGSAFGASETTVVRGTLDYTAPSGIAVEAKAEWARSRGDGAPGHNNGLFARNSFEISLDEPGNHRSEARSAQLRASWPVGDATVTGLTAWKDYALDTRNDIDSSPLRLFHSDTGTRQQQWSHELTYVRPGPAVDLLVGAYAFGQRQVYGEERDLSGFGQARNYGGGRQRHRVLALYANGDVRLSPALTLSTGIRWSSERKRAAVTFVRPRPECSVVSGTCPVAGDRVSGEPNGFVDGRTWSKLSPRLALSYRAADTVNLYASWTRGDRSGGYNLRITQPAAFQQVADRTGSAAYDAERIDAFEAGAKFRSVDGRYAVSSALFWTEAGNLQREVSVASSTSGLTQSVYNTADARIRGAEIEASFEPGAGFRLEANGGYLDARYRRIFLDISGDGRIDAIDRSLRLPRAPKWTYGGSVSLRRPAGASAVVLRADYQHRSRYAYTDNNFGWVGNIDNLDASIGIELARPAVTISLYGRNLLDEVQFGGDTQLGFSGGPFSDGNNRPFDPRPAAGTFSPLMKGRRLGLEISAAF